MTLKITFLGTGSAFTVGSGNYQSNLLLEHDSDALLIDAGTDVRHSLFEQNRSYLDIGAVFITHLHADHCGGLEWLALTSFFDPMYLGKPVLYVSALMMDSLWKKTLSGGLSTLAEDKTSLDTFFDVYQLKDSKQFAWKGITFDLVQTKHYCSNHQLMPSFGLMISCHGKRILYTGDTQFTPVLLSGLFEEADLIFHDCETLANKSGVHSNYADLITLPDHIKNKMWLYHYNPGPLPDAKSDGFLGFVVKGQVFEF